MDLGIGSGKIPDNCITASSGVSEAKNGRLNEIKAWCASTGEANPYYWAACAPSHKMGFRSSAAKNGLPGEGRHGGLVPRNDVLTNGFI